MIKEIFTGDTIDLKSIQRVGRIEYSTDEKMVDGNVRMYDTQAVTIALSSDVIYYKGGMDEDITAEVKKLIHLWKTSTIHHKSSE